MKHFLVRSFRCVSWVCLLLTAGAPAWSQVPSPLINEVLYFEDRANQNPIRAHEWIEIYNPGPDFNLAGWVVSNGTGRLGQARALPSIIMPHGDYLVVHFATGTNDNSFTNGTRNYYTGDPAGINLFNNLSDAAALYSPAGIVDFVAWNNGALGYLQGTAQDDAVTAGKSTAGAFVNAAHIRRDPRDKPFTVTAGTSIGRDLNSTDTNSPTDFGAHGGDNALDITPGARNLQSLYLAPQVEAKPTQSKKWTVMLYMVADDDGLEGAIYQNVKDAEMAGGSDDAVNVVVMFDGKNMAVQAAFDPAGKPVGDPNTLGGTWQFQLGSPHDTSTCTKNDEGAYQGVCYITMLNQPGENPFLGEKNMGTPATLQAFVEWAKTNYPAEKYGLIISGHGGGWTGVGFDATWPGCKPDNKGTCANPDALNMGELTAALGGNALELIGFDACLMGTVEVADQVRPYSRYMVASEETIQGAGWPFDAWVAALKNNPQWTGADLGKSIVSLYGEYYETNKDKTYTLSAIDLNQLPNLTTALSGFAGDLTIANDDFQTHGTPGDNVQNRILLAASQDPSNSRDEGVDRYDYYFFMDLSNFASRITADLVIPNKYKGGINMLSAALNHSVIASVHGECHPQATGLSIFMPLTRTRPVQSVRNQCTNEYQATGSYDSIAARVDTGDSQQTAYAANYYQLPLKANDPATGIPLQAPQQFPRLPAPNFLFVTETQWPQFLQRFYRPVADNHIIQGINPDGSVVMPTSVESGRDEITVSRGARVYFTAAGSSYIELEAPVHWMWDFDNRTTSCNPCVAPYDSERIVPGRDVALVANDHMDADRTGTTNALTNQKDADSLLVDQVFCQEPRDYVVTLNVWDDNHLFHGAVPNAEYVNMQTASQTSIVHCQAVPTPGRYTPLPNVAANR